MPVTKTAKRALGASKRKQEVNKKILSDLDSSIRIAKKTKSEINIRKAMSLSDRAAKKGVIHTNKAARIKASLAKLSFKSKVVKSTSKTKK